MAIKIAINGFGRIGRAFLRTILSNPNACAQLNVVAINIGPSSTDNIAHLFKYDSIMREFPGTISFQDNLLSINQKKIQIFAQKDPALLPWQKLHIDWVVDASGCFTTRQAAQEHINAGAKKVLITAPGTDEDITIIPGVNHNSYDASKHHIVSLGSCTTNCFAPMVQVLKNNFTLTSGLMTTVHSYTNDQVLLDVAHHDPRRARAAACNIIPTKTGADKVITKLFPELEGKIKATSLRVPTAIVSIVDFTFTTQEPLSKEAINESFEKASHLNKNIIQYIDIPLVSSDFIGNTHSCIFDSLLTQVVGTTGKVFAWYDNEYGYSSKLTDFLIKTHGVM
ncbi:type I glyceraldehyde-3-phosphate dehydrogenase [Candidatus Dependentiae bacterium]|nr:type I glyceraldehyde-3-phosphate dehydrogenase [Candidatus Dependentiae bacterium]